MYPAALFVSLLSEPPAVDLSTEITYAFQIINTLAIFWSISLIAYIFSTDTQAMEGKLIEYNKQLKLQASIDPLTGLNNRRSTMDFLNRLLKSSPNQISFCLCDIDFFKRVNDTYGHDVGDVVLKKIAETFRTELPNRSFISRWAAKNSSWSSRIQTATKQISCWNLCDRKSKKLFSTAAAKIFPFP